jgi:hypothetical protein
MACEFLSLRGLLAKALFVFLPFDSGHLPDLAGESPGDEVALLRGDYSHAGLFRDSSRCEVSDCLGGAKDGEAKDAEPEVVYGGDGLGHQTLALPWNAEPEAAVIEVAFAEQDGSYVVFGRVFESEGPVPLVAATDRREGDVAIVGEGSVGGVRPGNDGVQEPDDLPVGKETLGLGRVGELEGTQDEAISLEFGGM